MIKRKPTIVQGNYFKVTFSPKQKVADKSTEIGYTYENLPLYEKDVISVNLLPINKPLNTIVNLDKNTISAEVNGDISSGEYGLEVIILRDGKPLRAANKVDFKIVPYNYMARMQAGEYYDIDELILDGTITYAMGYNGEQGVSIESIEQTTTSLDSEGINIITITKSNGVTYKLQVRNGKQGERGLQGERGVQGLQGIGIDTFVQSVESNEDGGVNQLTCTLTDGNQNYFYVRNGKRGNGIASIEQTEESEENGGVNTWQLTTTDGEVYTIRVRNGSEATLTKEIIEDVLGYTPVTPDELTEAIENKAEEISEEIESAKEEASKTAEWGGITGEIVDQEDLQKVLDTKAEKEHVERLQKEIEKTYTIDTDEWVGAYYNYQTVGNTFNPNYISNSGNKIIPPTKVYKGMEVTIYTKSENNSPAYILCDNQWVVLDVAPKNADYSQGKTITIEQDCWLCCSCSNGLFSEPKVEFSWNSNEIEQLRKEVFVPTIVRNHPELNRRYLRVLDIGNSYSSDLTYHLKELLDADGIGKDMCYYICHRGGASYKDWYNMYLGNDSKSYFINLRGGVAGLEGCEPLLETNEAGENEGGKIFRRAIRNCRWDVIFIHQTTTYSTTYDQWESSLATGGLRQLIRVIKACQPQAIIGTYIIHSFKSDNPENIEQDTRLRWEHNCDAVKRMMRDYGIDLVVPYGTAIESLRENLPNSAEYCRDSTHLGRGLACYTAACTLYETVIAPRYGASVLGNTATHICTDGEKAVDYPESVVDVTNENKADAQKIAVIASTDMWNIPVLAKTYVPDTANRRFDYQNEGTDKWFGTYEEYEAMSSHNPNVTYYISEDDGVIAQELTYEDDDNQKQ